MIDWIKKLMAIDIPSPSDIIRKDGITKLGKAVVLDYTKTNIPFKNENSPEINEYWDIPDTNSMDATFDAGNNNILLRGADLDDQKILLDFIKVGDIVVTRIPPWYGSAPPKWYAIHRVKKIGYDKEGRYFVTRGDHNPSNDPYKSRDENILWLYAGTIA